MATTVENHTFSCKYSSDGTTWTDFSSYVESFSTHHAIDADRGTVSISCYEYPSGLAENNYLVCYVDGATLFNGRVARPSLHYYGNSVVIEGEGRGANLAKAWRADYVDDPLVNDIIDTEFSLVFSSFDDADLIVYLCSAASIENNMYSIQSSGTTRGTILPIYLRPGQTFWSLIRGENGLDEPVGYWTAERNNGAIYRRPLAYAGAPDFYATEGTNIISADRTPQGTESIINRCVWYGLEYEGGTVGGLGVGDYSIANSNIIGFNPKVIRNPFVESDAEALAAATAYVGRHNFPYDEDNITLLGDTSITIGQTCRIDSAELDHDGTSAADRLVADVVHSFGVGVGYETKVKLIRIAV